MVFKVFYAWQSDRPNSLCRGLIRGALDQAMKTLNAELDIEEADRVEIDQDIAGVPGSPNIAETILRKIRDCDAFVPDLTFMPFEKSQRHTPNPNVLIEYGYALGTVGDQRIVGVLNEAFGLPDELPFDIRHKVFPVRYNAADDRRSEKAKAQRRSVREELASRLAGALRPIIQLPANDKDSAHDRPSGLSLIAGARAQLPTIVEQYPWNGGELGTVDKIAPDVPNYGVRIGEGSTIFLRPKSNTNRKQFSHVETRKIVGAALQPMAWQTTHNNSRRVRNSFGATVFTFDDNSPGTALTACMLTRSGELHGIDRCKLQSDRLEGGAEGPYIATGAVEKILSDSLANFLDVARNYAELSLPLEFGAGLEGVKGYRLAVDRNYHDDSRVVGFIHDNEIGITTTIDSYDCRPCDVLLPLFEKIYDCADCERPNVSSED